MGSLIGAMIVEYGLSGVAIAGVIYVEAHARKNDKKIVDNKSYIEVIHKDLENINRKLDLIADHFMIKGMDKE